MIDVLLAIIAFLVAVYLGFRLGAWWMRASVGVIVNHMTEQERAAVLGRIEAGKNAD